MELSFVNKGGSLVYWQITQSAADEKETMKAFEENSVATFLAMFVRIVLWATIVMSVLFFLMLGIGLFASLNGGRLQVPFGDALSEGLGPEIFIAVLATSLVVLPGIMYICIQLRRILRTLANGDPFVPENSPRLFRIALAIAIMELARYGVILLLPMLVEFGNRGAPKFSVSIVAWVSAVAMLVFSQVFQEGTRLREAEKMTV